jgi:hypothetical protein
VASPTTHELAVLALKEYVVLFLHIHQPGNLQLALVVEAGGLLAGGFGLAQHRQEHGGQNGNNRNHHQQFDERECVR